MLFVTIKKSEDIAKASSRADGLELRLDCFDAIDIPHIRTSIEKSPIPVILTLRNRSQGGYFQGSESERLALIEQLFALEPHFFDLECDIDRSFARQMASHYPNVKIICSYHNFDETPQDLKQQLNKMRDPIFHTYKLATMAHSSLDALRMMQFVKEVSVTTRMIGLCMGEKGQITRILGPIYGNRITYCAVDPDSAAAPGQLSLQEHLDLYRYRTLTASTAVYGLIGGAVDKSLGHFAHNAAFQTLGVDAVYVKMALVEEELSDFFLFAKRLGIGGLSVTMPFKESVLPFLNGISDEASKIGAVNTIAIEAGKLSGTNTDGVGAVNALEERGAIRDKKVVILGAGGAAKAIAYIAKQRGAEIVILNRSVKRAEELALQIGGRGMGLDKMEPMYHEGYDVLINCTPDPLPIDPRYILSRATVMEIKTLPLSNSLLSEAKKRGAKVVYGHEMFINQAIAQQVFWLALQEDCGVVADVIRAVVNKKLGVLV